MLRGFEFEVNVALIDFVMRVLALQKLFSVMFFKSPDVFFTSVAVKIVHDKILGNVSKEGLFCEIAIWEAQHSEKNQV